MGIGILIFLVIIILKILSASSSRESGHRPEAVSDPTHLRVRLVDDFIQPKSGGDPLRIKRILVSGVIQVPRPHFPVKFRFFITDHTEGSLKPCPVLCLISNVSDENGVYCDEEDMNVPYTTAELKETQIGAIPLFALVAPKRGKRSLVFKLLATSSARAVETITSTITTFAFQQESTGYTEFEAQARKHTEAIVLLSLAVAASDGSIRRNETTIIHQFLVQRSERIEDGESMIQEIELAKTRTLEAFRTRTETPSQLIQRLCLELTSTGGDAVKQDAYELCLKVIAADGVVEPKEQKVAEFIAGKLELPPAFIQEARERFLRMNMFRELDDEKLLEIPKGLTSDQKRQFLLDEYNKWRGRVNHSDHSKATEAALRLEKIAKARARLDNAE